MTNLIVINPSDFKQREHSTCGFLESNVVQTITRLLSTNACFKEDTHHQPVTFQHKYNNNSNSKGTKTASKPSQKYKPTSYSERLQRDIGGMLNKINCSNASVIEAKLCKLVNQSNVDTILSTVLNKTLTQDIYTTYYVQLILALTSLFPETKSRLQLFADTFTSEQSALFDGICKLDYDNYEDFCRFGKYKTQLLVRQQVLFMLKLQVDPTSYIQFVTSAMDSCDNPHVIGVLLCLMETLMTHLSKDQVYTICNALQSKYRSSCIGRKNEFHIENIWIQYRKNVRLQGGNSQNAEASHV